MPCTKLAGVCSFEREIQVNMSPASVKKTQQQYQAVVQRLESKLLHLRSRREMMDTRAFVVLDEGGSSVHPHTPTASKHLDEHPELYHGEVYRWCANGRMDTHQQVQVHLLH